MELFTLHISVVAVILVQEVKGLGLWLSSTAQPLGGSQGRRRISAALISEDRLESLSPLNTVVKTLQLPELLQEVQNRAVSVSRVVLVHGTLIVDKSVGLKVRRNKEGGNAKTC